MLRKIPIFLTLLLIALLGYFSYKLFREKEISVNSLIDAIPFDATVIFEVNRPELLFNLIHKPPIDAGSFFNIPFVRNPLEKLKLLDSLASKDPKVKSILLRPHSIAISGHPVGKNNLEMVYYLKLNNEKEFGAIDKVIQNSVQAKGNITQHKYEDARIYDVSIFNRKSAGFSYCYYRGMFVLSNSPILVEEVIRQSKSNVSIRTKAGLQTILRTAGKSSPFNIYLNFDYFPTLASNFIHSRFRSDLQAISKFAHWVELDCNVSSDAIILNGFSSAENSNGLLADIFKDQESFKLTLPNLLPSGSKGFFALGISDYEKFHVNYSLYQQKNETNREFDKNLIAYQKAFGIDIISDFKKIFDKEIAFCYNPASGDSLSYNIFTIIKTKSNSDAKEFIATNIEKYTKNLDSMPNSTAKTKPHPLSVNILNTSFANIPQLLFGKLFSLNKNSYCVVADNYIIFGDSISSLNTFAADFASQKNMAIDLNYSNLSDLLAEDTYFYFYLSPDAPQLYRHFLKYTSEQILTQYKYGLSQVQAIVYQFGRNDNLFYNNAFIRFLPRAKGNLTKKWGVPLDSPLASPIYLVKNRISGKNEIMCQDKANNLYLISGNGEVLWKRKIEKPILSKLFQADLFRNKKLQMVFNTQDQVYAIDRNGKDIEGYPIKLKVKAISGMSVFDYDKNRNYRFLIPGADNLIYCLEKTGKEVEGWKKPALSANYKGSIDYFTFNGKDFITASDTKQLYFFDRKGKSRITTSIPVSKAPNSVLAASKTRASNQFLTTDSAGTINMIALNGKVTTQKTGIYPHSHFLLVQDINFDKVADIVFCYDNKFEAYNTEGARILNYMTDGKFHTRPKFISLSDSSYLISYTDTITNKIHLMYNTGEAMPGTPLKGNSELTCEILENPSNTLNLFIGDNNILYCYSVE
jgi:hypothetical protein